MTPLIAILAFLMGAVVGLLAGGGSILTLPILVYIADVRAHDAIAASLVVVGSTAAVNAVMRARIGQVRWQTGLTFGAVAMIGAYGGGRLSALFAGWFLLTLFAALMVTTSLLMLRDRKAAPTTEVSTSFWRVCLQGLFVGSLTGLIGAGGGFLIVPALVLLGGLSMHHAVGTSFLVIAMNSGSGLLGHLPHSNVPWLLTASVTGLAILGSIAGAALSSRMPGALLRKVFAWFVLLMGLFILTRELSPMLGGLLPALLLSSLVFTAVVAARIRTTLSQRPPANDPAH